MKERAVRSHPSGWKRLIVTDTTQLALWRTLLTGTEPTSAAPVVLRRHDRRSLRGWAQRANVFHTEDRLDRLHKLTGGWPLLVGRAHRLHDELGDPEEVLRRLAGLRADRAEARAFAEATGVYADPCWPSDTGPSTTSSRTARSIWRAR